MLRKSDREEGVTRPHGAPVAQNGIPGPENPKSITSTSVTWRSLNPMEGRGQGYHSIWAPDVPGISCPKTSSLGCLLLRGSGQETEHVKIEHVKNNQAHFRVHFVRVLFLPPKFQTLVLLV